MTAGLLRRLGVGPVVLLCAGILALALGVRAATEPSKPGDAGAIQRLWLLRDDYEPSIFLKRGAWAGAGLRPYLDVFSEYPPLATWSFGLPYLLVAPKAAAPAAALAEIDQTKTWEPLNTSYSTIWSVLMAGCWLGTAALTAALGRALGLAPARALALLAPAALYCALQRFDPLPAVLVSGATLALVRDRFALGGALLGAGAMVKIFPALLVPAAAAYALRRGGVRPMLALGVAFGAVVAACELPVFLQGASDPTWDAKWRPSGYPKDAQGSGRAALAVPFAYQESRDTNPGSLADRWLRVWSPVSYDALLAWLGRFRLLQAAAAVAFAAPVLRAPAPRNLVAAFAAVVTAFVLLHNIYSPQFVCWIVPLAVVAGGGRLGAVALATALAIDVATYLQFPLLAKQAAWDAAAQRLRYPAAFGPVIDLRLALTGVLLVLLAVLAFRRSNVAKSDPVAPPSAT